VLQHPSQHNVFIQFKAIVSNNENAVKHAGEYAYASAAALAPRDGVQWGRLQAATHEAMSIADPTAKPAGGCPSPLQGGIIFTRAHRCLHIPVTMFRPPARVSCWTQVEVLGADPGGVAAACRVRDCPSHWCSFPTFSMSCCCPLHARRDATALRSQGQPSAAILSPPCPLSEPGRPSRGGAGSHPGLAQMAWQYKRSMWEGIPF
jgi:hypothetical protein